MLTQNSVLHMNSLNVDALFTNIPLDEPIGICIQKLFKTSATLVKGISRNDLRDFPFKSKFYIQVNGVAMRSPLGPIVAIFFFRIMKKTS